MIEGESTRRARRWTALFALAALLAVAVVIYLRLGWSRMEDACTADPPATYKTFGSRWDGGVAFSYSLVPLGFQCTYDDGRKRTSLWF